MVLNFLCGKCYRKFAYLAIARLGALFSPKSCKKEQVFWTFRLNCLRFIVPLGELRKIKNYKKIAILSVLLWTTGLQTCPIIRPERRSHNNNISLFIIMIIINNYSPKGKWILVNIYQFSRGKYSPIFTQPEANNCFSVIFSGEYQESAKQRAKTR